jgi:Cu-Zn family superoxide dismutase
MPALAALVATFALLAPVPSGGRADVAYDLPTAGVLLEGIGYDQRAQVIYVSGVNDGGQIYRAEVGDEQLEVWQPGNVDGRTTARGIDVDDLGRVYVAGGPTGRVWVFDRDGTPLASLAAPAGTFLNDVWVAADGAAYVTNSNQAEIYRVSEEAGGGWTIERWLDASASIPVVIGPGQFNLGGIVGSPDGRYLVVAQGNVGALWRIELANGAVTAIGGASVTNADGLVLRGHKLYVVRNFDRRVTELRLSGDFDNATLHDEVVTPADRTFTTAKLVGGRLLAVDSQFGLPQPWEAEDRVVPLRRP